MFDWSPCISGKGKENHYTGGTLDKAPYNSLYVYWSFKHAISSRTGFKHKHQQTSVDQFKTWITFKDGSCYKKFLAVKFKDWVSRPTLRKTQYQGRTQRRGRGAGGPGGMPLPKDDFFYIYIFLFIKYRNAAT